MEDMEIRKKVIRTLFAAYGKSDDVERQAVYIRMLKDWPVDVIRLACQKAMLEEDYMPSVSKLMKAIKSLIDSMDDDNRIKEWDEAWIEINKVLRNTPWGKKPEFSTPEIEYAVNAFGWMNLVTLNVENTTTASAQIRRYYELACKRKSEAAVNTYLLTSQKEGHKMLSDKHNGGNKPGLESVQAYLPKRN